MLMAMSLAASQTVFAVTLIETKQADGSIEKTYVDNSKIRVDTSSEPGYALIDGNKGTMLFVSHEERKIIDMSYTMEGAEPSALSEYQIEFVNKGKGPTILGYATRHFEIRVNGKKCAEEFTSTDMPKALGIQETFEKIVTMISDPEIEMMPGMDVCMVADEKSSELYVEYGYPMRSLDAHGKLESEVIRIEKNAAMPKGGFTTPKDYQLVNMEDMMKGMQDMMKMSPEQMQNMSPEQQQQMQQMMDNIMQQMQQPQ